MLSAQPRRSVRGFTIVELLIVIVVIGILAALVLSSFTQAQARARDSKRVSDISAVAKALEAQYAVNGTYPSTVGVGAPDVCLSVPHWDCWGFTEATRFIEKQYMSEMPQDPAYVDSVACGFPNSGETRAYYYAVNATRSGYILGTRLEMPNTSDSRYISGENNGCGSFMNYVIKKNWP